MRRLIAVAVALSALVLAACTGTPESTTPDEQSPYAACPAPGQPATAPASASAPAGKLVPDVALPCFAGGPDVRLRALGRPAVINFFASWCPPCREELPAVQRLADSGRVLVLGVVTKDTRSSAIDLAKDAGLSLPALFDANQSLLARLGRNGLPVTLFLDASGRIAYTYAGSALTDDTLADLVRDKLHVDLP